MVQARLQAQAQDTHVFTRGQIDPEIRVQGGSRAALQNGRTHAYDLKPYFFLLERVNKSCERRKFSCICQRSSGVAARLRANR